MIPELIAAFSVGIVLGVWIGKEHFGKELTTEDHVKILQEKGYWVNLNVGGKK